MKKNVFSKLLMLVAVSLFLMATGCPPDCSPPGDAPEGVKKCVITHNGKDITISVNALDAHMDHHDDCFGYWIYPEPK